MLEKNWRIIIFLECYVDFKKKELKKKLYYWSIFIINLMIIWCFFIDFKNKLLRCELKIGGVRNFFECYESKYGIVSWNCKLYYNNWLIV